MGFLERLRGRSIDTGGVRTGRSANQTRRSPSGLPGPPWAYVPPDLSASRYLVVEQTHRTPEIDHDGKGIAALQRYRADGRGSWKNLLDDRGLIVSPQGPAFGLNDGAFNRPTGLFAYAGGGRDSAEGVNTDGLFLGRLGEQALRLLPLEADIFSLDISTAGDSVALLEWTGAGCVTVVDVATRDRRVITWLDQGAETIIGNETVRFSSDGAWLLLSPFLIEVSSGRLLALPIDRRLGGASWWDTRSPSSLLTWSWGPDGVTTLGWIDLEDGSSGVLGPVRLPGGDDLDAFRRHVLSVQVAADGETLLCQTWLGLSQTRQVTHGSKSRFALGRLLDRTSGVAAEILELPTAFLAGNGSVELEQPMARFIDGADVGPTRVAASFASGSRDAYLTDPNGR